MLVKNRYSGKTKEEAINNAKISLQELEENLYIKEIEYSENTKIGDILKQEQIPIESVVVKQDGETVSEKEFVKDGSEIEIIKVIYGG